MTTVIDELSYRKDRLIHFLRKQVHTESNNTHVALTKRILQFWYDGNLESLSQVVPIDVYESIDLDGEWFTDVHKIIKELCHIKQLEPIMLLELKESEIDSALAEIKIENERDKKRVYLIFQLYNLLLEKYSLESVILYQF